MVSHDFIASDALLWSFGEVHLHQQTSSRVSISALVNLLCHGRSEDEAPEADKKHD